MLSTKPDGGDPEFVHLNSVLPTTSPLRQFVPRRGCTPFRTIAQSKPIRLRPLRTGHLRHSHLMLDQIFTLWTNDTHRRVERFVGEPKVVEHERCRRPWYLCTSVANEHAY